MEDARQGTQSTMAPYLAEGSTVAHGMGKSHEGLAQACRKTAEGGG